MKWNRSWTAGVWRLWCRRVYWRPEEDFGMRGRCNRELSCRSVQHNSLKRVLCTPTAGTVDPKMDRESGRIWGEFKFPRWFLFPDIRLNVRRRHRSNLGWSGPRPFSPSR